MKTPRSIGPASIALATALFAQGACGGETAFESQHQASQAASSHAELPLLALSVSAPWTTAYAGLRRVETLVEQDGAPATFAYRERVAADGAGSFAVDLVETLSFVPDQGLFQLLQRMRTGLFYRYRDFAVRDVDALRAAWIVTDLDQVALVAGRACQVFRFAPANGRGASFEVALDQETGLVLRAVETDARGAFLSRMEFESYDPAPDLDGVAWFTGDIPERPLDPSRPLGPQAGFEVFGPAVLPAGFAPWRAAIVDLDDGGRWVKQIFTDGVRPLFFFHRDGAVAAQKTRAAATLPLGSSEPVDRVFAYKIGATSVVEAMIRGREILALGAVDKEALIDLIESAIE